MNRSGSGCPAPDVCGATALSLQALAWNLTFLASLRSSGVGMQGRWEKGNWKVEAEGLKAAADGVRVWAVWGKVVMVGVALDTARLTMMRSSPGGLDEVAGQAYCVVRGTGGTGS